MPDIDSGSASTFSYLRILKRAGFGVTFVPAYRGIPRRYVRQVRRLGINAPSARECKSLENAVGTLAPQSDILLLYRGSIASRVFDIARRANPAAKIIFHPVDLHFLRMQREAALSKDETQAAAAEAMRAVELDLIRRADATIVVSTKEHELLKELAPEAPLHRIPILREAPQRPFHQALLRRLGFDSRSFGRRRDVLFIGGYEFAPNVDAVEWFVGEVWPILRSNGFADRFIIAGANPTPGIKALESDRIKVVGYVEDLAGLFARCRLSVAPLRYGGGIKGKVVSSLSHGVPVVGTSIAAEGMGLRHGEHLLVADEPTAIASEIIRLYNDEQLWHRLSANGYDAFKQTFDLDAGAGNVLAVFDGLMRRLPPAGISRLLEHPVLS